MALLASCTTVVTNDSTQLENTTPKDRVEAFMQSLAHKPSVMTETDLHPAFMENLKSKKAVNAHGTIELPPIDVDAGLDIE